MDEETFCGLKEVVDYLYEDEEKDFEASEGSDRHRHIFNSVKRLSNWAAQQY